MTTHARSKTPDAPDVAPAESSAETAPPMPKFEPRAVNPLSVINAIHDLPGHRQDMVRGVTPKERHLLVYLVRLMDNATATTRKAGDSTSRKSLAKLLNACPMRTRRRLRSLETKGHLARIVRKSPYDGSDRANHYILAPHLCGADIHVVYEERPAPAPASAQDRRNDVVALWKLLTEQYELVFAAKHAIRPTSRELEAPKAADMDEIVTVLEQATQEASARDAFSSELDERSRLRHVARNLLERYWENEGERGFLTKRQHPLKHLMGDISRCASEYLASVAKRTDPERLPWEHAPADLMPGEAPDAETRNELAAIARGEAPLRKAVRRRP